MKERFESITDNEVSGWKEKAVKRIKNREWLRYSRAIALRILDRIDELPEMNQSNLASLASLSRQQISKIVKGHENLTLETIARLGGALQIDLLQAIGKASYEEIENGVAIM